MKQDDAFEDLSNILGELKGMAIDMGSEIERSVIPPYLTNTFFVFFFFFFILMFEWIRSNPRETNYLLCYFPFYQYRQNKALDHVEDDVDELNFRVKGANQRTRRLLGK